MKWSNRFLSLFASARLKLTIWYLVIIMCISVLFSFMVYRALTNEIDRFATTQQFRVEQRLRDYTYFPYGAPFGFPQASVIIIDPDLIAEIKQRIIVTLGIINGFIFVSAGLLGYMLAGHTLKPIERMVAEQDRFIGDAAHELRTPLTSLKTALEVHLRDKKLTLTEARQVIADSVTDVDRLASLSESLLVLSRFDQMQSALSFTTLRIDEVVQDVVKKLEPLAKKKSIRIHANLQPTTISGDTHSISHIITILLDNAIKYSDDGKEVHIIVANTKHKVVITIADQGIGIEATALPHIFDRFYRADTARSWHGAGGFGLGLAIAKKIIENHRGEIRVSSTQGTGSTFTISFTKSS